MEWQFGACRWVWNYFLRQRIDHYAETGEGLNYYDNARTLVQFKQIPDTEWLREALSQGLQLALMDLQTAYRNFFAQRAKYPKFKNKRGKQAFRIPQGFRLEGNRLKIPKISPIRIVVHRPIEGKMKSVTISRTRTGKYFASFLCELDIGKPRPNTNKPMVGIDLGLIDFAVTSEGEHILHPHYLREAEKQLKRAQRILSRCKKGSKGRKKARQRVALLYEKITNQRKDFLHKLSYRLISENQAIFLEDLTVKNMVRNHYLAKSISDSGWGEFVRQCKYKGLWYGCHVGQVDKFFPSSKRCSGCGFVIQLLPLSVREWVCPSCKAVHDRDENAAINILTFGIGQGLPEFTPVEKGRSKPLAETGNSESLDLGGSL